MVRDNEMKWWQLATLHYLTARKQKQGYNLKFCFDIVYIKIDCFETH